jgi:hypothetical protein
LEHEGVERTNNSVERALRTGVQWRKICFGNRSASGERATSRLLTVAETCDLQRLNNWPIYQPRFCATAAVNPSLPYCTDRPG